MAPHGQQGVGHRGHSTKLGQLNRGWGRYEDDCWEEEEAPPIGSGGGRRRRKRSRGRGGGRGGSGCLWELFPDE